nr:MAG TPA: hypothetical protein [Caudoviricetes sp.]
MVWLTVIKFGSVNHANHSIISICENLHIAY